ncbi:MAG: adenosylcobinamide-GDP ribazoletransferase [Campylobacterota bacterium]
MNNVYLGIKFALSYFTLLPVRFRQSDDLSHPAVLRTMLLALPAIGLLLAGLSVALFLTLEPLGWIGAVIAAGAYMILYGFLHIEAIIDVADAIHAAHSGKDPYTVIKEPTVGAMGVLYGAMAVLFKTALLASLLMHQQFAAFAAVAVISRLGLLGILALFAFRSTFVSQLRASFGKTALLGAVAVYSLIGFWLLSWPYALALGSGIALALLIALALRRALGFLNGDTLGASLEAVEILLILGFLWP